jgi:hypothetical protein
MSAVGTMVQSGVLTRAQAERVIADAGNDPTKIKSYAERAASDAIKEADKLSAQTTRRGQDISAGTTIRGQNLTEARERDRMERELQQGTLVPLDDGYGRVDKFGNINRVQGYGNYYGPNATAPAPAIPPAAANALITTQPSVNSLLNQTAPQQGAGPTVAAAAAMDAQNNVPRPKQPFRQPVAVMIDDKPVLVAADKAMGMTPATAGAEQAALKKGIAKEGKESVNRVLSNLYSEYGNLVKSGGITDTRRSVEENIAARTGASAAGQLTGSFTGSEAQSFRDSIEQTRPLLLTAIMKATGLSATQLNSNVELQTYLRTATDPKVSIQSNVKALNNISQMFGLGEKFDVPEIPKAASGTAKPEDAPPTGLSPEIAKLWPYMTPEDRKLWK